MKFRCAIPGVCIPCLLVASVLTGCGGYGEVSPLVYEYAKALYSVCNQRDKERLDVLAEHIDTSLEQQEITKSEAGWLNDIIGDALDGHWESAAKDTRRLMEDQIKW